MFPTADAQPIPPMPAVDAFARLATAEGVFWLDSSLPRPGDGRFSIMGCEPRWVFTARDDRWEIRWRDGQIQTGPSGALERLDDLIDTHRVQPPAAAPHLPFFGGAVGWLAYDLGRQFESIGGSAEDDLQVADIRLGWYDAAIVWDHEANITWIVTAETDRPGEAARAELRQRLESPPLRGLKVSTDDPRRATSDMSRRDYMDRVEAVRSGIADGEYYQLNLVHRFTCRLAEHEPPAATYLRLREANPAPFAAFLGAEDEAILSSSPERFIEVTPDRQIRTCPIKGTRPRGDSAAADEARRAELLGSAKERAELLMIVDLMRNDLGRICTPGTVEVARLHAVESFAAVHHLVGEVRGRLRSDVTRREILRAVFPGGSITGAPKVSAMRAIERFERHRRGVAMGSIGYFSAHGRIDLNIAIRTIRCRAGWAQISVGAGIVWDSDPTAEYEETLVKARPLFAALRSQPVDQ